MFTMQSTELKRLERFLVATRSRAFPFATKATLNSAAFDTRKRTVKNIGDKLVERNKFTRNSIRVEKTTTLIIEKQESRAGSIAPYFPTTEEGGVKRKKSKRGIPIPTTTATGEAEDAQPRTRLPKGANKLSRIQLRHKRYKAKNRRQRNIIAIREAQKTKRRYIYLDLGRRQGIFRVGGGKRNPKIKMVYDLSSKSVVIPPHPTLQPAYEQTKKRLPIIYARAVRFQLKRAGLVT